MDVAVVVISTAAIAGAVAAFMVTRAALPDLDDPHISRGTIRRVVTDRPLVNRLVRAFPGRGESLVEALAIAAVVVIACAFIAGITLVMIRTGTGLARADRPVADWAADRATTRSSTVMREISKFGGTAYILVGASAALVYGWWRERRWSLALFVLVTVLGQFLVSNSIKWSVDRARPTVSQLTGFAGTSFPSGHAVAGAAVWAALALLLGRGRSRPVRGALFGLAVGLGVAVAGTRVALGVHWTTDVIVGLVIGWSWFAVCALLFGGRRLRPAEPLIIARQAAENAPTAASGDP